MGVVGANPGQRRRVSVKVNRSEKASPDGSSTSGAASSALGARSSSAHRDPPSPMQSAAYIADMCSDLAAMARGANLPFLAHLLAMAQAEAERGADTTI